MNLDILDFLNTSGTIFDVRSPGEYAQGHLPGAISLPLFSDAERAAVGTTYKQIGKEQAIEQGLAFVGPKLADFVATAKRYRHQGLAKVHCWRGGMRSASMAWLFNTAGLKTATLNGGYKSFRRWVLQVLQQPRHIHVLGGLTGSGKTAILQALQQRGEQILNLEHLACHRGSSFGVFGMPPQPSNEQFENEIACQWASLDPNKIVWIEDESRMIGKCQIPPSLYHQMRQAPLLFIECPAQERLQRLLQEYGTVSTADLMVATERLSKRLGGARTKEIITYIQMGNLSQAIEISLDYYDATYRYGLSLRNHPINKIYGEQLSAEEWAQKILEIALPSKCCALA